MYLERRRAERIKVNLPAHWEGTSTRERGTISDISVSGCFLLTGGEPTPGEAVNLALELSKGRTIQLSGEVVYRTEEIGFAVRFRDGGKGHERLVKFVNILLSKRRIKQTVED